MHRQFWITAVMRWAGMEMPPPFVSVRHFGRLGPAGNVPTGLFGIPSSSGTDGKDAKNENQSQTLQLG